MTRIKKFKHEFVEYIPSTIEESTIYISIPFSTVVHKCACGCRNEIVTPVTPTDWQVSFNGEAVSLSPSVGSWNLDCESHYWIRDNKIQWAGQWSKAEIKSGRKADQKLKKEFYSENLPVDSHSQSLLDRVIGWFKK